MLASWGKTTGGGAPPPSAKVTLRNTGIQTGSAASYTVAWPSGTLANDLAVIMGGHGFAFNIPSGWTQLNIGSGTNWNGVAIYKILSSGDISTGSVAVTTGGSFNGVLAIATIQTGTFDSSATPLQFAQRNGSGSSSITFGAVSPDTNGLMLYFGSNRAASSDTVSIGVQKQQANDGSAASGCLYAENSAVTNPTPIFSYSVAGSGNYQIAAYIPAILTVPSWIRGTGIQSSVAASFTVTWPVGTLSGDMAIIMVGGGAAATTPSGWTNIDNSTGTSWEGATFYRVLNSTDITNGSVSVSMSGSADCVVAIVTIKSGSLTGFGNPTATTTRNSTGASSRTVNYTSSHTDDYVIYFGSFFCAGAGQYATCSLGNFQLQATDSSHAAGCLYAGSPASVGTISPSFLYSGSSSGDYQAAVLLVAPS